MEKELNFEEIQNFYNNEHTWKECCKKFNVSWRTLYKHKKKGKLIGRNLSESNKLKRKLKPYKTSEETKRKISVSRKKYLDENKDRIKWPGNDSDASLKFKNILNENNISYVEEFKPLEDRFFRIDISFPDKKIGIEINGEQHYERNGNLKEYYQKRHDLIESEGWKLYEISHYLVYKKEFLENLINELKNNNLENVNYSFYIKDKINRNCNCGNKKAHNAKSCWMCYSDKNKIGKNTNICKCGGKKGYRSKKCNICRKETIEKNKIEKIIKDREFYCECGNKKTKRSNICIECFNKLDKSNTRKIERPPYKQLLKEIEETNFVQVGKKYGVTDNAIRKWINMYEKYGIDY
jgi:transposase